MTEKTTVIRGYRVTMDDTGCYIEHTVTGESGSIALAEMEGILTARDGTDVEIPDSVVEAILKWERENSE